MNTIGYHPDMVAEREDNNRVDGKKYSIKQHISFYFNTTMAKLDSILLANAVLIMFLFIYVCGVMLMFFWGGRDEYKTSKDQPYLWFIVIARSFGYTLNLNCALVILLGCKLLFTKLRNTKLNLFIPFDKIFPTFHIVIGYAILVGVLLHASFHMIWVIHWNKWTPGLFNVTMSMSTGYCLLFTLSLLIVTSYKTFREKKFNYFYFFHNLAAIIFFSLLFVHGVYNTEPYTYKWIVAPVVIYLVDRITRILNVRKSTMLLQDDNYSLVGNNVIKLKITKPFDYRAGQYAEILIPSISRTEWHPFTIASAPEEDYMTFYIKAVGDWTNALKEDIEKRVLGEATGKLDISVRGPFGAPAQHVDGYDRIVLLCGGIGATPFVSVCKHICLKLQQNSDKNVESSDETTTDDDDGGYDYTDEDEREEEEEEEEKVVKHARIQLNKSINLAYDKGNEMITNFDNWEYVQSASPVTDATTPNTGRDQVQDPWAAVSRIRSHPNLSAGVTPRILTSENNDANTNAYRRTKSHAPDGSVNISLYDEGSNNGTPITNSSENEHNSGSKMFSARVDEDLSPSLASKRVISFAEQTFNINNVSTASMVKEKAELELRLRTMQFFHSITLNMFLWMLTVLKLVIMAYVHLYYGSKIVGVMMLPGRDEQGLMWLTYLDLFVGIFISIILALSMASEISLYQYKYFLKIYRNIDFFLLLPVAVFSNFIPFYTLFIVSSGRQVSRTAMAIHFGVLTFGLTILMMLRLLRIIGNRIQIANRFKDRDFNNLKRIDMLWTCPKPADDEWIRNELKEIKNYGRELKLHRYLTRTTAEEVMEDGFKNDESRSNKGMKTELQRPNWENVLMEIAERSDSDSKIGIFFCGNHKMGATVKEAMMKVQVKTLLRGVYLGTSKDDKIKRQLGLESGAEVQVLRRKGSNIHFAFRQENFS